MYKDWSFEGVPLSNTDTEWKTAIYQGCSGIMLEVARKMDMKMKTTWKFVYCEEKDNLVDKVKRESHEWSMNTTNLGQQ